MFYFFSVTSVILTTPPVFCLDDLSWLRPRLVASASFKNRTRYIKDTGRCTMGAFAGNYSKFSENYL